MDDFLKQLGLKLISYVIFFVLISVAMLTVMTGEFPPHIAVVQEQYRNFQALRKAANQALQQQQTLARMQAPGEPDKNIPTNVLKSQSEIETNSLRQQIGEIRVDQARLANKLETLIHQNERILQLLESRPHALNPPTAVSYPVASETPKHR